MPQNNDLQGRLDNILSGRDKGERLQTSLLAIPEAEAEIPQQPQFTPFDNEQLERATDLASSFMRAANQEGLEEAVAAIERASSDERIAGLVQYATKLFITHHPQAREILRLKPLEYRQPYLALSSQTTTGSLQSLAAAAGISFGGATPPEDKVSFWREDPLLNEHHEHWHLVYPEAPINTPAGPKPIDGYPLGDRHGELFAYMHEQMIARYDAERLAVGIGRVEPFDRKPFNNLNASLPQGYDPGFLALYNGNPRMGTGPWYVFRKRPAGATISDLTRDESSAGGQNWSKRVGAKITDQAKFVNDIYAASQSGQFEANNVTTPVTIDNLSNTVEANYNSVDFYGDNNTDPPPNPPFPNNKVYGNLHNDGHIHLMLFDNKLHYGVMAETTTAVRDPIFFRWHKLVDDIFFDWQKNQEPYDFSGGPPVKVHDIILCREDGLPDPSDGQNIASEAFGYSDVQTRNHWEEDFTTATMTLSDGRKVTTTDELVTEMLQRQINLQDPQGDETQELIDFVSHDDFYYFIRVQNLSDQRQKVTVRIFIAPETESEDRRSWIEMDKLHYELDGEERAIIFQPAELSAVIRKPALRPSDLTPDIEPLPKRKQQSWCDCGWPYTMLLPRGTKDGMDFRVVVMLSSGDDLNLPNHMSEHLDKCGTSISYCGLQDMKYPDKQNMGYPFDRKFSDSIWATISKQDNWGSRLIKIRCRNLP